jgi:hypothetical protein
VLIRSTKENVSQTIPFVQLMGRFVHHYNLYDLMSLNKFQCKKTKYFGQDDGGVKDEHVKEEKLAEYLSNKQKQLLRQKQLQVG